MTRKDEENCKWPQIYFGPMEFNSPISSTHARNRPKIKSSTIYSDEREYCRCPQWPPTPLPKYCAGRRQRNPSRCEAETRPFGITIPLVQQGFDPQQFFSKSNVYLTVYNPTLHCNWKGPYSLNFYSENFDSVPYEKMMNMSRSPHSENRQNIILNVIKSENPPLWMPVTLDTTIFYYIRRLLPRRILLPILYWFLPNAKSWSAPILTAAKNRRLSSVPFKFQIELLIVGKSAMGTGPRT